MKYGHARISIMGQDLRSQINTLEAEGCDVIFTEQFTGTKIERKEFSRLISEIEKGDTLVVTKLDRFAKSVRGGIEVIKDLFDLGVRVHVLNMGIIENTPTGQLVFNIKMSFEEFERDMILKRKQEGKDVNQLSMIIQFLSLLRRVTYRSTGSAFKNNNTV